MQSLKSEQQSYQLTIADEQPRLTEQEQKKRVRHIYLEEENIYGRFVPYLLLRDQLQSEIDSTGSTALHHMCSYNSPYLPLFLSSISHGDPILNKKNKLGHTPLDAAGLYCSKENIQLLKAKGAIDNGNVDFWAIQGGNPTNWSGKVYPQNKQLVHWAAYNDEPQVIAQFAKQGVSISEPDSNGFTPVDLTILNKSYNSLRVLTEIGERPKEELLKSCDSISIKQLFEQMNESEGRKRMKTLLKIFSILIFLSFCLILNGQEFNMALVAIVLFTMLHILVKPTKVERFLNHERNTEFVSELFMGKLINRRNHISYMFFHLMVAITGVNSLCLNQVTNHFKALLFLLIIVFVLIYTIHLLVQVYGICRNLTYSQLFYSYKWSHLWEKIKYIKERKIVVREFLNSEDRSIYQNVKDYFFY